MIGTADLADRAAADPGNRGISLRAGLWLVTALFAVNIVGVFLITFAVLRSCIRDRRRLRQVEVSYLNQEVMLRGSEKLATSGTPAIGGGARAQ